MINDINYYNYKIDIKDKKLLNIINNFKYDSKLSAINNINQLALKVKTLIINNASIHLDKINNNKLILLNDAKKLISYNIHKWNKYKIYSNDYELIYNPKPTINSVSIKEPVSRSYFKMIELINDFLPIKDTLNNINNIKTFHIAEAPGGFIEAFIDTRHNNLSCKTNIYGDNNGDIHYTISLLNGKNIPTWDNKLSNNMLSKYNKNINILSGINNDGDILNISNVDYILERFKYNKMDIITADGGFNLDNQYLQEYMSSVLIYAEFVLALGCLKKDGHYIFKIYDIHYTLTKQIIIICHYLFKNCTIIKPKTSRPGNSEKYVICTFFKGISEYDYKIYYDILKQWLLNNNNIDEKIIKLIRLLYLNEKIIKTDFIINIVNKLSLSKKLNNNHEFSKSIDDINTYYNNKQIDTINNTLINLPYMNDNELEFISRQQFIYAKKWCQDYNV